MHFIAIQELLDGVVLEQAAREGGRDKQQSHIELVAVAAGWYECPGLLGL
jgi:hypothetical protein